MVCWRVLYFINKVCLKNSIILIKKFKHDLIWNEECNCIYRGIDISTFLTHINWWSLSHNVNQIMFGMVNFFEKMLAFSAYLLIWSAMIVCTPFWATSMQYWFGARVFNFGLVSALNPGIFQKLWQVKQEDYIFKILNFTLEQLIQHVP